jgi:hypothetical protein
VWPNDANHVSGRHAPTTNRQCVGKIGHSIRLEKTGVRPKCRVFYMRRSQLATALGSNLTQVPIPKRGMRRASANLNTVIAFVLYESSQLLAVPGFPVAQIRFEDHVSRLENPAQLGLVGKADADIEHAFLKNVFNPVHDLTVDTGIPASRGG